MAYTLSKIFVGTMTGSVALLARGASQKECASAAHIAPPVVFAFSMSAFTSGESGLAGGVGAGAWARAREGRTAESIRRYVSFLSDMCLSLSQKSVARRDPFRGIVRRAA